MTQREFITEVEKLNVNIICKHSKWGSIYYTIDGVKYRYSDHSKPESHFSNYEEGLNDFRCYEDMLEVVKDNVEKENKVRHLTWDQKEILGYGRWMLNKGMTERFNVWIKHHEEFHELNEIK